MKKSCMMVVIITSFIIGFVCTNVQAQTAGTIEIQPQVGKSLIPTEDIREIINILKSLENAISKLSQTIEELKGDLQKAVSELKEHTNSGKTELSELIKGIKIPEIDLKPLEESFKSLQDSLESLKSESIRKLDEEAKFLREELSGKLEFLTTVMRRAMIVFQNMEDLTKEAQVLKEQIKLAGEEAQKAKEFSQKGISELRTAQNRITGLLVVNLLLLSFLVFLEVERKFRKPQILKEEKTEEGRTES